MKLEIVCLGKLRERFWQDACSEYQKRLTRYCKLEISELSDHPIAQNASPAQEEAVRNAESEALLRRIKGQVVVAMDVGGKQITSPELARLIGDCRNSGRDISFVIGGSLGFNDEVRRRSDHIISFGRVTYPHQLMRVILLEQIYRGFKILSGETYHK